MRAELQLWVEVQAPVLQASGRMVLGLLGSALIGTAPNRKIVSELVKETKILAYLRGVSIADLLL
jgi:hypothetical protein